MMKLINTFLALVCILSTSSAFTPSEYAGYIDELMKNPQFVEEYQKWSAELFADPDYLYGSRNGEFPCPIPSKSSAPKNVHELSPEDITCVGALGDSLTAALGAHAITPFGLMIENRGVSWAVGADGDYSQIRTVPNIIRNYQKNIRGGSTKFSIIILNGQNATNNGLNIAESGDVANDMPGQAGILMQRIQKDKICDWENDWKMITLFIGGNDLCGFCKTENAANYTSNNYVNQIKNALDILYNGNLPRTLVNVVPIFDIRQVESLNSGGLVCQLFHKLTCPCAAYPTDADRANLTRLVPEFQNKLSSLIGSGRYDGRDDFSVVLQPFFSETILPKKVDGKPEFSLFAPDCFHFSGKGHSFAALSLWNNMLEPVGGKQKYWYYEEQLKCPSERYPYIFTNKNSAKALAEGFNMNTGTTSRGTTAGGSTPRGTTPRATTSKSKSSKRPHHHDDDHHKHDKSDSTLSTAGFVAFIGLFVLLLLVVVVSIVKRQKIRLVVENLRNSRYNDIADDVEIYSRPTGKNSSKSSSQLPPSYGSRINFE